MKNTVLIEQHLLNAMREIDRAIAEIVRLDDPDYSDPIQKLLGSKVTIKYQLNKYFDTLAVKRKKETMQELISQALDETAERCYYCGGYSAGESHVKIDGNWKWVRTCKDHEV